MDLEQRFMQSNPVQAAQKLPSDGYTKVEEVTRTYTTGGSKSFQDGIGQNAFSNSIPGTSTAPPQAMSSVQQVSRTYSSTNMDGGSKMFQDGVQYTGQNGLPNSFSSPSAPSQGMSSVQQVSRTYSSTKMDGGSKMFQDGVQYTGQNGLSNSFSSPSAPSQGMSSVQQISRTSDAHESSVAVHHVDRNSHSFEDFSGAKQNSNDGHILIVHDMDNDSRDSYTDEHMHTSGVPHYAEGIVVHVDERAKANQGAHNSGSQALLLSEEKQCTSLLSSHSTKSQAKVHKPCRITFKVENLPSESHYSKSSAALTHNKQHVRAGHDSSGSSFMEGILIQHEPRIGEKRSRSTMTQRGEIQQEEIRQEVQEKSYAAEEQRAASENWQATSVKEEQMSWVQQPDGKVEYFSGDVPPESALTATSLVTGAAAAEAASTSQSQYAWKQESTKVVEPEWQLIKEWTVNEKGERVETETKMIKNEQGEWVKVDPVTGSAYKETTVVQKSGEWASGEEWVTRSDGTTEKIEYEWVRDPDGTWVKRNRLTQMVLMRDVNPPMSGISGSQWTSTEQKWITRSDDKTEGIQGQSGPLISGEYWMNRGGAWKRIPYQWVQGDDGQWKKMNTETGKPISRPGENWKTGTAWKLNNRAVPKKARYVWTQDGNRKWRMVEKKTGRQIDTTWQEGTEMVQSKTGDVTQWKQVPYRWTRNQRGDWVKLNRDTGEVLGRSRKGRSLDITRAETTYIVPDDGTDVLKRSTTRRFEKGKLVSEDAKTDPVSGPEAQSVIQDAQARSQINPRSLSRTVTEKKVWTETKNDLSPPFVSELK